MGLLNRKKTAKKEKPKVAEMPPEPAAQEKVSSEAGVVSSRILVKPLITEKAAVAQSLNKYSFIVSRKATKTEIKRAIKEVYGIIPTEVNVINVEGKKKISGRLRGRRQDFKKALVTLPKGKAITIHEGV